MSVRWRTRTAALLVASGALLGLTGCGSSNPLPVFDQEQTTNDIFLSGSEDLDVENGSSRFLGTDSRGIDYYTYLTRDETGESICLVIIADSIDGWASACGSLPVTAGAPEAGIDSATLGNFRDIEQPGEMVGEYVAVEGPEY